MTQSSDEGTTKEKKEREMGNALTGKLSDVRYLDAARFNFPLPPSGTLLRQKY